MTTKDYNLRYPCPVCDNWISGHNIAGDCPYCGSQGFKTLRNKGENNGKKEKV